MRRGDMPVLGVVETLPADAANESLAEGVGGGRTNGCLQHASSAGFGDIVEVFAELIVAVTDEKARSLAPAGCLSQLPGRPYRGWFSDHVEVHDATGPEVKDAARPLCRFWPLGLAASGG